MTKPKSAGQNAGLKAQQASRPTAMATPAAATISPGRPCPCGSLRSAVRETL